MPTSINAHEHNPAGLAFIAPILSWSYNITDATYQRLTLHLTPNPEPVHEPEPKAEPEPNPKSESNLKPKTEPKLRP